MATKSFQEVDEALDVARIKLAEFERSLPEEPSDREHAEWAILLEAYALAEREHDAVYGAAIEREASLRSRVAAAFERKLRSVMMNVANYGAVGERLREIDARLEEGWLSPKAAAAQRASLEVHVSECITDELANLGRIGGQFVFRARGGLA